MVKRKLISHTKFITSDNTHSVPASDCKATDAWQIHLVFSPFINIITQLINYF